MKNKVILACVLLLSLAASRLGSAVKTASYWITWNVGQGLWSTLVTPETCFHFDMGGERSPLSRVQEMCGSKENRLFLSHWDWDHIGFAFKASALLSRACLDLAPEGPTSRRKEKLLPLYPTCESSSIPDLVHLLNPSQPGARRTSNELSHVLSTEGILLPGDSVRSQEKAWAISPALKNVRWLELGHHGSRTSTSEELLRHLPHLVGAIASARRQRYGHPHFEVRERLHRFRVPLLTTEDWGNIWVGL